MKKIGFKGLGIYAVAAFSIVLASCGGSSGGGDKEIDFDVSKLVNKYWYYNGFVNSSYDAAGVLLVYKFQGNNFDTKGKLVRQQFSGRVDEENVGTWELIDDKLTIVDNTVAGSPTQEWYLRNGSSETNLKLRGAGDLGGDRDFYAELDGLDDVTADAFVVSTKNSDGSSTKHIAYEVSGKYLEKVVAMPNKDSNYELTKSQEFVEVNGKQVERTVFRLADDAVDFIEEFNGEKEVKFYIELSDGTKWMLNENLPNVKINSLDYVRDYSQSTHEVSWNANLGDGVFYRVEVLNENGDLIYRSLRQPENSNGKLPLLSGDAVIRDFAQLQIDDEISIRIIAFKYEEGVDATNSSYKDSNIQAKATYTYKQVW